MALFTPTIAGTISGSIGAITFSRNAGGAYMRSRVMGTNPNTPLQVAVRNAMGFLSNRWCNVLTSAQHAAWEQYAGNVPILGKTGGSKFISGLAQYIRSNLPRLQADPAGTTLPLVDSGPTVFDVGEFTIGSLNVVSPSDDLVLIFDNTQAWANEDEAGMLLYSGPQQNPTINFFKGPFRLAGAVLGDSGTPPVSPAVVSGQFLYTAPRGFGRIRVTRADGRLSYDSIVQLNIT